MQAALEHFSKPVRAWFEGAFSEPTAAQAGAWQTIPSGKDTLVVAPTGSGKTLAAFLWALDRLATSPIPEPTKRLRVVYVSPLKALAADIERNLRSPLAGIHMVAERLGLEVPNATVALRTGDTPQDERRRFTTSPPDILITTPESLYLLLTSQARAALAGVATVIIDEVHSIAGNKRGAHLALTLERLEHLLGRPVQRVGLSATVRPPEEIARFLRATRPVEVVHPQSDKRFEISIVVPVDDMAALGTPTGELPRGSASGAEQRTSIWPHVEQRILELIRRHNSTIVFVNSRGLAERLCTRLNALAEEQVARAHHGSVSKEQRRIIEEDLKAARLPAVVATSSLELGIDMAAVDLVVQVEAPDSVTSALQRVGRAGHQVGETSRGTFFPKHRGDLAPCVVVTDRLRRGEIESTRFPRNPLDVLAQQIVAMVAMDDWDVDDLYDLVRRAANFCDLPRSAYEAVLDMLSGRYPSDEFADLRPRLNWDRTTGHLSGRRGAQRVAVTSGGTIPDRGLFGVFLAGDKPTRVGELDEEMVYESRAGEVFVLGSSSWLIEDISHDRVLVTPAPGQPGKMPFWHGDAPGRAVELGKALGTFTRELMALPAAKRTGRLDALGLDPAAAANLVRYLEEQKQATSVIPDDRTIVIERYHDELGDWRICIHSPFGARLHAPWSHIIQAQLQEHLGVEVQTLYTDDGIMVRLLDLEGLPQATEYTVVEPERVESLVVDQLGASPLFAGRFRECAARALLIPKRRPGSRTPLWQQRQRSAQLLQVARRHASFPIVLEAVRECLHDFFDVPALEQLMTAIRAREVRLVEVETNVPSPFATSLQFSFIGVFMYEGDAPLAERKAQALALDRQLLAELLGHGELRELIDEGVLAQLELELQWLTDDRKAVDVDGLHDLLRSLGDLSDNEIEARTAAPPATWLRELESTRRALRIRVAASNRWIAIEDAARYRDAVGAALPVGVPDDFLQPVEDPLGDLVGRYARSHGPFTVTAVAERLGLGRAVAGDTLERLQAQGRVSAGEFRPGRTGLEWVDRDVLRRLQRRSLAVLAKQIEPSTPEALARFSLAWHGVGTRQDASPDALVRTVEQLQGAPLPASALETHVLPARLAHYSAALLDELCAAGEIVWCGSAPLGSDDGWITLTLAEDAPALLPPRAPVDLSPTAVAIEQALGSRGALFFRQIAEETRSLDDAELLLSLWELVWAGVATNDTLAPVRALVRGRRASRPRPHRRPAFPARLGPPSAAGRWSLVPARLEDATRRLHRQAQQLLARHGIVTRGAVAAERAPGGFAALYPVLKAMEETGRCRRGYFVEGLGGAQFSLPGAVDRMRSLSEARAQMQACVLAATDPANPYGAALPWPGRALEGAHRAGRKVGALVVLVDGHLATYVERGGRSMLSYSDDTRVLSAAAEVLAAAVSQGTLGRITFERADGRPIEDTALGDALAEAGFRPTYRGLALRA